MDRRALLPVSASFAETGIVAGTLLFALMAASNVFTGELLLWQSLSTGHRGIEEISGAVGGRAWRVRLPCSFFATSQLTDCVHS